MARGDLSRVKERARGMAASEECERKDRSWPARVARRSWSGSMRPTSAFRSCRERHSPQNRTLVLPGTEEMKRASKHTHIQTLVSFRLQNAGKIYRRDATSVTRYIDPIDADHYNTRGAPPDIGYYRYEAAPGTSWALAVDVRPQAFKMAIREAWKRWHDARAGGRIRLREHEARRATAGRLGRRLAAQRGRRRRICRRRAPIYII